MSKGVTLGFCAFALFSLSDACVKAIHGALPPYQVSFFGAAFSIVVLPFIWRRGETVMDLVRAKRPWLWFARGALGTLGSFSSVTAFSHLSMAEAFALIFLMPLMTTALSVFFLKEKVSRQGWAAIMLGFVGVLIVLRPGFREIGIGHLAALTCGICGSVFAILLRHVGNEEKPVTLFGAALVAPMIISAVLMVPGFVAPTVPQWLAIFGFAVLGAAANIALMVASRRSPASRIAPTQYSQMLWGLLLGYLFFGDRLDGFTGLGVVVIVGAGLWLFLPKAAKRETA
jgi:S-adenosylmethionine uptake transporter